MKSTTPPSSIRLVDGSRTVLWKGADAGLIDGIVNGVGQWPGASAAFCGCMQSGNIRSYATWVLFGGVLVIVAMSVAGGIR